MKKIVILLITLVQVAFCDYRLHVTNTNAYIQEDVSQETEIFFGDYSTYQDYMKEISLKVAEGTLNGLSSGASSLASGFVGEGLKSAGAGAGIGLFYGGIQYLIDKSKADQIYIKINKITLKNGETELKSFMFQGNKKPMYSEDEIRNYMGGSK